jgi:hypothetical protein
MDRAALQELIRARPGRSPWSLVMVGIGPCEHTRASPPTGGPSTRMPASTRRKDALDVLEAAEGRARGGMDGVARRGPRMCLPTARPAARAPTHARTPGAAPASPRARTPPCPRAGPCACMRRLVGRPPRAPHPAPAHRPCRPLSGAPPHAMGAPPGTRPPVPRARAKTRGGPAACAQPWHTRRHGRPLGRGAEHAAGARRCAPRRRSSARRSPQRVGAARLLGACIFTKSDPSPPPANNHLDPARRLHRPRPTDRTHPRARPARPTRAELNCGCKALYGARAARPPRRARSARAPRRARRARCFRPPAAAAMAPRPARWGLALAALLAAALVAREQQRAHSGRTWAHSPQPRPRPRPQPRPQPRPHPAPAPHTPPAHIPPRRSRRAAVGGAGAAAARAGRPRRGGLHLPIPPRPDGPHPPRDDRRAGRRRGAGERAAQRVPPRAGAAGRRLQNRRAPQL